MTTIGLINPGAMGASVGAAAAGNGHTVIWAGFERSGATHKRAANAGLEDCGKLEDLVAAADVILSVCPPASAEYVAADVAANGFSGLYLDGNAIAPNRARAIGEVITARGATYVDGGIIGGPAWQRSAGTTLHLAGEHAEVIAAIFRDSPLLTNIVSDQIGAASALKMVFAAYTKGSTALLSAILGVAEKEGVRADLEKQWGETFTAQTHQRVTSNTAKAWRFVGEMEEIAATFAGASLSDGFHLAAADTFNRLARFKDQETPTIDEVLAALISKQYQGDSP